MADERNADADFQALVDQGLAGENAAAFREGFETQQQIIAAGALLKRARESVGLSQTRLAERIGMAQPAISRLENGTGDTGPELRTVIRYLRGCGLELELGFRPAGARDHADVSALEIGADERSAEPVGVGAYTQRVR